MRSKADPPNALHVFAITGHSVITPYAGSMAELDAVSSPS